MQEREILYYTVSVCPECLRQLPAVVTAAHDGVYLEKICPEHGRFRTLIWADDAAGYRRWLASGGLDLRALPQSPGQAAAFAARHPFGCEACAQPASAALMTTNRCNMDCPVCFTRTRGEPIAEPGLAECGALLRAYRRRAGDDALVELCGGEPTVRTDILELAALAREIGFDFIQLNTNGIRLAQSAGFCRDLKAHGVTTVYMGFDGVTEKPYLAKYGKPMLAMKRAAVENCAAAGLAVVLVVCVIPGENDGELGGIVEFARAHMPAVRGVFLQPISYFGIYPPENIRRITIPDVIRRLSAQCDWMRAQDFGPGTYEHPQCSFNACYLRDRAGNMHPLTNAQPRASAEKNVHTVRRAVRTAWLPGRQNLLTVGGMAFQDAWNADLLRVSRCSIQIIQKTGGLVPLCSKYLSACDGGRILPGIS